jgi:aminobenzoyl-glutamate utilization protein B
VPTVTLRYPANIPNLPGHHWANAIAMATPIAHKGTTAGARAQAMMILDLLMRPELVQQAKQYFAEQTKTQKYEPLIGPADQPVASMNRDVMERYRPEMRKLYFDPTRYKTYLDQLGITYPTVR